MAYCLGQRRDRIDFHTRSGGKHLNVLWIVRSPDEHQPVCAESRGYFYTKAAVIGYQPVVFEAVDGIVSRGNIFYV